MNDLLVADPADDGAVAHLHPTTVLPAFAPAAPPASADPATPSERSDLIDRAYGEYRQLRGAGVAVDPDAFCARFPAFQTSLRRLLEVHREVEENPALLEQLGARWPQTEELFLGFQLLQELGRGAFARVFLAKEKAVGRRLVVVKVSLQPDNEADTLGKLRHPNVVPIYSTQYDAGTGFSVVCMPFLGSATLSDALEDLATMKRRPAEADALLDAARDKRWQADGAPPPARVYRRGSFVDGVLHIGERLADALAYVHAHGFLHRDLKPNNVLLCPNGEPILLDFNLALDRSLAEHRMGGTLPYMAPEQLEAMGRSRRDPAPPADARGDVYALGVILYEVLAREHPFGHGLLKLPASEVRACLLDRQRRGPRPLRELNPNVDARLAALIERCLAFDPVARPASARALRDALRRCQSAPRRAVRWAAAHKVLVAVAGALVAAGTAGAAYGIASLPSAAERHRQDAIVAAGDGRYDDAVRLFTAALEADPNQPDMYFRRGRAHQLQGEYDLAIQDYLCAGPETNGKVAACLGYCMNYGKVHVKANECNAIQYNEMAIRSGFVNAAVYNNLAFSHLRYGPKHAEALKAATGALTQEPGMLAASYNRALAVHGLWSAKQDPDVVRGIEDIRHVIAGSTGSLKLFQTAAELCAAELQNRGNPPDDPLQSEGESYLHRAVERGQSLTTLKTFSALLKQMPSLKNWVSKAHPKLAADSSLPKSQGTCDVLLRLVDPLNRQPE
jgi:serine/threonine protein kinase